MRQRFSPPRSDSSRASKFDGRKETDRRRLNSRRASVDLRRSLSGNVEATGLVCVASTAVCAIYSGILHLKSARSCKGVVHKDLIAACALDASADVRAVRTSAAISTPNQTPKETTLRRMHLAPFLRRIRILASSTTDRSTRPMGDTTSMPRRPRRSTARQAPYSLPLFASYRASRFDAWYEPKGWRLHRGRTAVQSGRPAG